MKGKELIEESVPILVRNNEVAWIDRMAPVEISLTKLIYKYKDISPRLINILQKSNPDEIQNELELVNESDIPIPFQVDRIDPQDHLRDVLVFIAEVHQKDAIYRIRKKLEYLFRWNEIPGEDNGRLMEFLTQKFDLDRVKTTENVKVVKVDNGRTIDISTGKNSLSLKLNDEKNEVNLDIDDVKTDKFIAKKEYDSLYIYKPEKTNSIQKGDARIIPSNENWDFKIKNKDIEVHFHRGRIPNRDMAGSAYFVKIRGGSEVTCPFGTDHQLQEDDKRLMQIKEIWVSKPWNPGEYHQVKDIDQKDYEYVNSGEGPVRCFLTIRSKFELDYEMPLRSGPNSIWIKYQCYLYRIISLFSGKYCEIGRYHINEELYVEAKNYRLMCDIEEEKSFDTYMPLNFKVRFYMYIPRIMTRSKSDYRSLHLIPDAIVIGNIIEPNPAVGFASSCHIENISSKAYGNSVSWYTSPTWHQKCIHIFIDKNNLDRSNPDMFHIVGSDWYNDIYTPLWGS